MSGTGIKRPSTIRSRSTSTGPSSARVSRLPVRDGGLVNRSKTVQRTGLEKKSIDRNFTRSKSTLGEPSRLSRQRSGSLLRLGTPSSQTGGRSIGKSPTLSSLKKDNRPITDKKWQYEQLVKVKSFIARNEPSIDHNLIKTGMSTDMFIALTATFFRMIDKRIIITRENYVEVVPSRLRLFRYPTNVKPSLMKTVNTPHSWSSVIAILSWLTDTVIELNREEELGNDTLHDIALKCFIDKYNLWNMGEEDPNKLEQPMRELEIQTARYFGNDLEKLRELENRCHSLEVSILDYSEINKRQQAENLILREKCEFLQNKCDSFLLASKQFEEEILQKKASISKKCEKLDKELENLILTEKNLKEVISNQPCSITEQKQLISEINDLKNIIRLQEERCQQQKAHVHAFDHQLSDLHQKIQTSAYTYNNLISEMEILDPSFKELHIRESGFIKSDTEQNFDVILQKLTILESEKKEELNVKQSILRDTNQRNKMVKDELASTDRELQEHVKLQAELELSLEHKNSKLASEKQLAIDKLGFLRCQLSELKSKRPNIEMLQQKLLKIQEECNLADKETRELKYKALRFFLKLEEQISENILNYMKIMDNISEHVTNMQEKMIEKSQYCIDYYEKISQEIIDIKSKVEKKE
ncbi:hypothetical protein RI129_010669 [Pyrocoelia pectoralis]|uniref:Kinetochore protein NDC80 n=1 Tax=Pyrocoelia pectoralis TaxID=417401 RepID=A0AAN7V6D4_9COLE